MGWVNKLNLFIFSWDLGIVSTLTIENIFFLKYISWSTTKNEKKKSFNDFSISPAYVSKFVLDISCVKHKVYSFIWIENYFRIFHPYFAIDFLNPLLYFLLQGFLFVDLVYIFLKKKMGTKTNKKRQQKMSKQLRTD